MSVKVLVSGDSEGEVDKLISRLNTLQNSAHGPFHVLFVVGSLFSDSNDFEKFTASGLEFPLETYVLNHIGIPLNCELPKNMHLLSEESSGFVTVKQLTVAFVTDKAKDSAINSFDAADKSFYKGCDLLLSHGWPRDLHQFLDMSDFEALKALGGIGSGSKLIASTAAKVRPRYHFATEKSRNIFYQRPPYSNDGLVATRFIALASVSDSKDKDKKWLHALSLEPIIFLESNILSEIPTGSTDCPYAEVGKKKAIASATDAAPNNKRMKSEANTNIPTTSFFFGGGLGASFNNSSASSSRAPGGDQRNDLTPPNGSCKTLFVGGIGSEVPDKELLSCFPNCISVHRPAAGKNFAFLEFRSHADAVAVIEASSRKDVLIRNKRLKFGWSKEKESAGGQRGDDHASKQLLLQPPSADATRLFIGNLPFVVSQEDIMSLFPGSINMQHSPGKTYLFLNFYDHHSALESVTSSQQIPITYQQNTLSVGWADSSHSSKAVTNSTPPYPGCTSVFVGGIPAAASELSQATLEALIVEHLVSLGAAIHKTCISSIHRSDGKEYAFIEFSSPSYAERLVSSANLSTTLPDRDSPVELVFGWAKGKSSEPSSHDDDCWFCLGSPSVKTHLIISISDHSYVALPKGGIADYHMLISPIECVPNRLRLSKEARLDISKYEEAIDMFYARNAMVSLRFERTIRTKGKDHMQEHMIPIPAHKAPEAINIFMQSASNYQLFFHEIPEGVAVDDMVTTMEGGPYQEYFTIELPVGSVRTRASSTAASDMSVYCAKKRFVYVPDPVNPIRFPMHLGLEIAANALGMPQRANWKNCVISDREEVQLAERVKKAFGPFDFATAE